MNLAFKLRPQTLNDFLGQEQLIGKNQILERIINGDRLPSLIFWGPPGSGKTTLAHILASHFQAAFYQLSAVENGKKDLLEVIAQAKDNAKKEKKSIVFVDEIHRWNKAQQDTLLPYVESGLIALIGATTENPSFEIISPLLSRCKLLVFQPLPEDALKKILTNALNNKAIGTDKYAKKLSPEAESLLIRLSGGDARVALNALELAIYSYKEKTISEAVIQNIFQTKTTGLYDKKGDEHYHVISAFIKSMRGSDVNAALYYLFRMLESGEDPRFVARRMVIFASEDIGLADRGALIQAMGAFEAITKIGLPEAKLILAHVVVYLARAKKSRAIPNAMEKAINAVYQHPNLPVPLHLRNPSTKLKKQLGYGQDYKWSEEYVGPKKDLSYLPEKIRDLIFYEENN